MCICRFQDRHHKPLGHPSAVKSSIGNQQRRVKCGKGGGDEYDGRAGFVCVLRFNLICFLVYQSYHFTTILMGCYNTDILLGRITGDSLELARR